MVTHDLVQRGLTFEAAYGVARALREELAERGEVSTAELRERIDERLLRDFPHLSAQGATAEEPRLEVTYGGQPQPFSRGLLAQSLHAAGLPHDRSYRLALDIQQQLLRDGPARIESQELAQRAGDLLERWEGTGVAGRYRLLRRIGVLSRPVVVYLGGATGTGKSTLAVDLAPLLRIYRVNSTDTIREVMRLGVTPAMLPSLHRSSFELDEDLGLPAPGTWEASAADGLARAFDEQAVRVCVGVRAVVERAIAENTSIVVEGVHLVPPLVPFADLEGAACQVAILLLTSDEEVHRSHLLARARRSGRRAERYLERFAAIRHLQEVLLQRAEEHEIPLLDTTDRERTAQDAVRLVTAVLERRLPGLAAPMTAPAQPPPSLMLVIDGLADRPLEALGGRTPLEAAHTPTLDRLAREGRVGIADAAAPGVVPDTASGMLAVFGQSPRAMKRGAIEALGADLELPPRAVALRGNFATLDETGLVLDRRAGRIREGAEELAAAIDRLALPRAVAGEVEVWVRPGTEHRLAIALVGPQLSPMVVGSDPGDAAMPAAALLPRPVSEDDEEAARTAEILGVFEQEARRILHAHPVNERRRRAGAPPANAVLTRAPGRVHRLLPPDPGGRPLRLACVSGDCTVLGIARAVGGRDITAGAFTGNLDTDLAAKLEAAAAALDQHDLVLVHVKGADVASHDRRPEAKVAYLEALDRELASFLERARPTRVAIATDHATYSDSGQHGADPVPVLLWGAGIEADAVPRFDERCAPAGSLGRFALQNLIDRLFE
jgi:2,3-bisphosphoglycerate-independent phosphoglycerate mutase